MAEELTPAQAVRLVASRRGGLSGLAKDLKLTGARPVGMVWAWINRDNVPPEHAAAIERRECGQVTVEQLTRGIIWRRVPDPDWPHPSGRPCIDVAAGAHTAAAADQAGG